jgi:hypothetical protein
MPKSIMVQVEGKKGVKEMYALLRSLGLVSVPNPNDPAQKVTILFTASRKDVGTVAVEAEYAEGHFRQQRLAEEARADLRAHWNDLWVAANQDFPTFCNAHLGGFDNTWKAVWDGVNQRWDEFCKMKLMP